MKKHHNNLISVIIPAHNEENVISRCLTSILQGLNFDEAEIIVVCNGCTDQSAQIVQSIAPEIQLIETPIASKANALNIGDKQAKGFPRIYIDADILIDGKNIKKLAQELRQTTLLAASPALKVDFKNRPWSVKAFYQIWCCLPFVTKGTIGCGVYALTETGRNRFNKFPEITADDGFVRFLFAPSERGVIKNTTFTIFPPKCFPDLIRIRIRQCFGVYELKKTFPNLATQHPESNIGSTFFSLFKNASLWLPLLLYICVNIFSHIGGRCKFWFGDRQYWNRDKSSRL
jgi:glycosyltransferase involved in cell wall biosynthesis